MRPVRNSSEIDDLRPRCGDPVRDARSLMRNARAGILSTHSVAEDGYPYGSLTRFLLTVDRRPIMYLRQMSPHGRNLVSNPKVSLTVTEGDALGPKSYARVTLLGEAQSVPEERLEAISAQYFAEFPARRYGEHHAGYRFYWIDPVRLRYSAHHGEAFWIEPEEWFNLIGG